MSVLLNLPRAVTVPFSGAGILAHNVLQQFHGQVLKLHAGLNTVVDDVAQHPLLRRFIVDERAAAPVAPLVPLAGPGAVTGVPPGYVYDPVRAGMSHLDPGNPGAPLVREPALEPMNPIAKVVASANVPDADAQAVERAKADAARIEDERLKAAEKANPDAPAAAERETAAQRDARVRAAGAGAAPGAAKADDPKVPSTAK